MAASPGADVEAFWLARHFDSGDDVHSGVDSFAALLHGGVVATSASHEHPDVQPATPSAPPPTPVSPCSPRSPTAAPPAAEAAAEAAPPAARLNSHAHAHAHASERWRLRMARGGNGSQNDLLSWSATLGEPVQDIVISNALDPGHTLIRRARRCGATYLGALRGSFRRSRSRSRFAAVRRVTCADRPGLLLSLTEHLKGQQAR
jgi:hypothetical protein